MNTHTHKNDDETVPKSEVALREEAMLAFWKENDIFNKSLQKDAPNGEFIFYDGPPFATGLPHYGHILASAIKDAVPRFWTMNGYSVPRKWGWDCHGLPLENLIEKKLGLATKRDIEEFGVKNFNEAARGAVMEYADVWREVMPRMGRWADMEDDYKTMDSTYTESVWWVFSELHKKGLVFEGFKTMHLCPRCGTTLSNFEVNQGYKDIKDIAVTVKLPLNAGQQIGDFITDGSESLLVWTTTPWTLPGNMAAAVHQEKVYVKCAVQDRYGNRQPEGADGIEPSVEYIVIAEENLKKMLDVEERNGDSSGVEIILFKPYGIGDKTYRVENRFVGSELEGKSYIPPFDFIKSKFEQMNQIPVKGKLLFVDLPPSRPSFFDQEENARNGWKIWHADYVEVGEEGTGAVHIAPAYGDDDMKLAQANNIPIVHHVDNTGHFMDFVDDFKGQLVKPKDDEKSGINHVDADVQVRKKLEEDRDGHGARLFKKENITHSYPHCWRCDTPLLNYATTSWFVNVPKIKDELIAANNTVK